MTKESKKKKFRIKCLTQLKKPTNPYLKDKCIVDTLYLYIRDKKVKNIMLYIPLSLEVDIVPFIKRLRKEGINVYVPFMEDKSFRLVKYRLPLKKKRFGIKEPNNSKQYRVKKIDLAIVPMVGVDATHRRVGFGKGMYDRFFEKENKNIKEVILLSRTLCYSHEVVTDAYDVKADYILTY